MCYYDIIKSRCWLIAWQGVLCGLYLKSTIKQYIELEKVTNNINMMVAMRLKIEEQKYLSTYSISKLDKTPASPATTGNPYIFP